MAEQRTLDRGTVITILRHTGGATMDEILLRGGECLQNATHALVESGRVHVREEYIDAQRRNARVYRLATTNYDSEVGTLTVNLSLVSPDVLGELMRAHVFGTGQGYRDYSVCEPYLPVGQQELPTNLVDEMLGEPECRDEWSVITAYSGRGLTIAIHSDGDTSLAFIVQTPAGQRIIINHDAKHDYGWTEI